jgi:hypothetical protein
MPRRLGINYFFWALWICLHDRGFALRFRALDVLNGDAAKDLEDFPDEDALGSLEEVDLARHVVPSNGSDVQELFFPQRLDHFRTSDPRTFLQRYFYSSRHVHAGAESNTSKPTLALLCVGGEGPAMGRSVLINSRHCSGDMLEFAKLHDKEYSIHLFALEHRYYGKSYPEFSASRSSPVSNQNLVYLSSRQAIADIGHFITHQEHAPVPTTTSKPVRWIAFGGSYPGMLAAWSRLKLPHLIDVAISSSAPVQQVLDMSVYKAHEGKMLSDPSPDIGGSPECFDVVQRGHEELVSWVQDDPHEHEDVARMFHLCDARQLRKPNNVQMWLGDGVIDLHVQENDSACTGPACSIGKVCQALLKEMTENNATRIQALAAVAALQRKSRDRRSSGSDEETGTSCVDISWRRTIEVISDPVQGQAGGLRSWLWQTCTEVGYFQTCEANSTCPYARGYHLLGQDLEICDAAFGVGGSHHHRRHSDDPDVRQVVAANVQETLETYGGWSLQATRVLSVNGEVDPWSELALQTTSSTADRPIYRVPGASHHFWTNPVRPSDSKEVQEAREIIFRTVLSWLGNREEEPSFLVPQHFLQAAVK